MSILSSSVLCFFVICPPCQVLLFSIFLISTILDQRCSSPNFYKTVIDHCPTLRATLSAHPFFWFSPTRQLSGTLLSAKVFANLYTSFTTQHDLTITLLNASLYVTAIFLSWLLHYLSVASLAQFAEVASAKANGTDTIPITLPKLSSCKFAAKPTWSGDALFEDMHEVYSSVLRSVFRIACGELPFVRRRYQQRKFDMYKQAAATGHG